MGKRKEELKFKNKFLIKKPLNLHLALETYGVNHFPSYLKHILLFLFLLNSYLISENVGDFLFFKFFIFFQNKKEKEKVLEALGMQVEGTSSTM